MTLGCMKAADEKKQRSKEIEHKISEWNKTFKSAVKLLLLGTGESGKTTIIKQMKILNINGFSDSERKEEANLIRQNIHEAIYELCSAMTFLQPETGYSNENCVSYSEKILCLGTTPALEKFNKEYFDYVSCLWSDEGIQECYRRSNEFQLIDSAKYFLDKVEDVSLPSYIPNDQDILHARRKTTGIQKIEFSIKVPLTYGGGSQLFWMFDVGGQRGERRKWIQVFEGINAILFLVAASDFDQTLREETTVNRLKESLKLFEDIWNSRFLQEAGFIIFFNKQDILKDKVHAGRNIGHYFPEYINYSVSSKDGNPFDEFLKTRCFIRDMFLKKAEGRRPSEMVGFGDKTIPVADINKKRQLFYHFTVATDTNNIKTVFKDVHTMIIKRNLNDFGVV